METDWNRVKLDRAIVLLLHRVAGMDIGKHCRISAANRTRLRADIDAFEHLLSFTEYAINQLNIGGSYDTGSESSRIAAEVAAPESPGLGRIRVRPAESVHASGVPDLRSGKPKVWFRRVGGRRTHI
jgi:hypothetical protein